ncbi:MAG: Na+/H+ antiporter NhaC family protein [Pseudomonadota bacterium]
MSFLIGFLPILFFIALYVGSGIYFTIMGVDNSFYQLSPLTAIIPAIVLGWFLYKGKTEERMHAFLDGVRHRDIITMCIIFLLAGAFSEVTKSIGSVDSTVNMALSFAPSNFLLIGLFLISAFISTAIGTSMGTIATVAPIAVGLAAQGAFPTVLGVATVISGAMFGDNLSIVSDTTIAAVLSQEANMKKKLKLNAKVAIIASILTILVLIYNSGTSIEIDSHGYSVLLVFPYIILIVLAGIGVNVFGALSISLVCAFIVGKIINDYSIFQFSKDIVKGFSSMEEIMILSLMVGGLSGLSGKASSELAVHLGEWVSKHGSVKMAQFIIAKMVSIFDILLANNTIAIIFTGEIARNIAKKHHLPPHYSAVWLSTFSCVFQGIIPYGAQVLLASSIAEVSPLSIIPQVYYCYILAVVSILYISFAKVKKDI